MATKDTSISERNSKGSVRSDFSFPSDLGVVDASDTSISLSVLATIVDRRAGTTSVEEILGEKPNLDVIANQMATPGVRESVAEFILSRKTARVVLQSTPVKTIRKGEVVLQRESLLTNLNGAVTDADTVAVLAEFIVALAFSARVITESVAITKQMYYPAQPVTIAGLTEDLIAQSAVRAMEGVSITFPSDDKMSAEAFSEVFAEALVPVGYALLASNDLTNIFMDVVRAIRARLLIGDPVGMIGSIDDKWINHPLVQEMSTNYIFLEAAREIEYGASVQTRNSMFALDRDAPMALASLKSSRRFAIVKADEYKATYGKLTLRTPAGQPAFFYGWRAASMAPVAQNVSMFDDATMPNRARNIVPGSEAASRFIASSFPKGETVSTSFHINKLAVLHTHLLEGKDPSFKEGLTIGQTFIFGDDGLAFSQELVCLLADRVKLVMDPTDTTLSWVYVVKTDVKYFIQSDLNVNLLGEEFYTKNIGLALLVMKDFTPSREMEPRSQLLGEKAMFTRVVAMPDTRFADPNQRLGYRLQLGGGTYSGSIRPREVGMNDMPLSARFVVPVFNEQVARTISQIQTATGELIKQAEMGTYVDGSDTPVAFASDAMIAFMRQTRVQSIVDMARAVSVQYRQTVDGLLKIKALAELTNADALEARGILSQTQFMGYADLIALHLIFATNGLDSEFIINALKSESLVPVLLQHGSDRKPGI